MNDPTPRLFLLIGALFGLLAVLLGAFGAHALADQVTPARLTTWRTAVHYLGWHGTLLVALAAWCAATGTTARLLRLGAWTLVAGTLLFSGSLLLLVLADQPVLGAVTPVGGVTLAVGWLLVGIGGWRTQGDAARRRDREP